MGILLNKSILEFGRNVTLETQKSKGLKDVDEKEKD